LDALIHAWGYGLPDSFYEQVQPLPRTDYEAYTRQQGPLVVTPDLQKLAGLPNLGLYRSLNVRSTASVSLMHNGKLVGRLYVGSIGEFRQFSENDQALLQGMADQAAVAIQNARLLQQVHNGREQLRQLTHQVVNAQEEERQRLSRELHDGFGQVLTVFKISLELLQKDLPPDLPLLNEPVAEMVELAGDMMDQIRVLAYDLRPPALDTLGLDAALDSFCREFAQRTKLIIKYIGMEVPRLSETISITFYRLLQEALTNVVRHAQAQNVLVKFDYDGRTLSLHVADNGQGFDVHSSLATSARPKGLGLLGMKERVMLLGGSLEIDTKPGQGTRLEASIPVS
jgi:signal transduction histidine kinase